MQKSNFQKEVEIENAVLKRKCITRFIIRKQHSLAIFSMIEISKMYCNVPRKFLICQDALQLWFSKHSRLLNWFKSGEQGRD